VQLYKNFVIRLHQIWEPDQNMIGARVAHRASNQSRVVQVSI
jgi:hypothetical protein